MRKIPLSIICYTNVYCFLFLCLFA
jgi:hypothetical protein